MRLKARTHQCRDPHKPRWSSVSSCKLQDAKSICCRIVVRKHCTPGQLRWKKHKNIDLLDEKAIVEQKYDVTGHDVIAFYVTNFASHSSGQTQVGRRFPFLVRTWHQEPFGLRPHFFLMQSPRGLKTTLNNSRCFKDNFVFVPQGDFIFT